MATNNICGDCMHFSDVGKCRIAATSKRDTTGFFRDACALFTNNPAEEQNMKPKKENNTAPATKTCKDCGRELPLDAFGSNKNGKLNICRECISKRRIAAVAKRKAGKETKPEADPTPKKETQTFIVNKREFLSEDEAKQAKHNAILSALTVATDEELAGELKRRGWRGQLHKEMDFENK